MFLAPQQANACNPDDPKFDRYRSYVMEPKLDGWRCIAVKEAGASVELYSRTGHSFTDKLPHLVQDLNSIGGSFIMDGEVGYIHKMVGTWPIFDYNATARVLGSGVGEALSKQAEVADKIRFLTFDRPDLPLKHTERYRVLRIARNIQPLMYAYVLTQLQSWSEKVYDEYVLAGGEGAMLKNPEGMYVHGKRPAHNWIKVKKFETTSARITGFIPGEGKYSDTIGAIMFCTQNGDYGKCSGMDDETRRFIGNNDQALMSRWIEIKHYGKVGRDQEGLRHPIFLRFRPDLDD